jgi:mRNA interferase RelE/StbE
MGDAQPYQVMVKASAEKEMAALSKSVLPRVAGALRRLAYEPRPHGSKKLHGHEAYRLRVGDYRILYTVNDRARRVEVIAVAHRKDAYRDL